jgi:putative membrane-bound dehydrogenase-like protein
MLMRRVAALALFLATLGVRTLAADKPPKSLDPRLEIQLFADAPQIVTPTDLDVDHLGRVWAIECNTHFRPPNYKGHESDRLLVFSDENHDGKADRIETFADGFVHAMSVAVRLGDGVYLATRKDVFHLVDTDGDGKADRRDVILRLETPGDYPHNGLAGFAFDGLGFMYIGLGENLGAPYRLVGTDGRSFSGGGEGGSVFRCRLDGSDLTLWATGFWNPHASCVDAFGRMFTVDNDPDDRPPCRLVHIVPGGDYGYRFRNGRRGIHPFTAWDGELPGTLPMVSGTGEAPSGIVAYESDAFPSEYRGALFATSWGDHRIDRFLLRPQATSFTSKAEPLIVGGENFRPVGLALAPDGSLFATDWVLQDYKVHGHGRIWRIGPQGGIRRRAPDEMVLPPNVTSAQLVHKLNSPRLDVRRQAANRLAETDRRLVESIAADRKEAPRTRLEASWALARRSDPLRVHPPLRSSLKNPEIAFLWPDLYPNSGEATAVGVLDGLKHPSAVNPSLELLRLVKSFDGFFAKDASFAEKVLALDDRFVFAAAVQSMTDRWRPDQFAIQLRPDRTPSPRLRLALLLAARQSDRDQSPGSVLSVALDDPDFAVRRTAIQWVGEARLAQFQPQIERQLSDAKTTSELFEATLASLELLDGVKRAVRNEFSGADYAMRLVKDERAADRVRAVALRVVPPGHKGLDINLLKRLLGSRSMRLRYEAVRTLCDTTFPETPALLRAIAADEQADRQLRLAAIAGLATVLQRDEHDSATLALLGRILTSPDHEREIAALRALRRSLRNPDVLSEIKALADAGGQVPSRELADQLTQAFRLSGLSIPEGIGKLASPRPRSADDWIRLAALGGSAEVGRRLFEHPNSGGCFHCHTINGRGGRIGPDLSIIARSANRAKLAESVVRPSKEIAPQFTSWTFVTRDGRVVVGAIVAEDREGHVRVGTPEGTILELAASNIEERHPQNKSVMPEGLVDSFTPDEFRDLIAFLTTLK